MRCPFQLFHHVLLSFNNCSAMNLLCSDGICHKNANKKPNLSTISPLLQYTLHQSSVYAAINMYLPKLIIKFLQLPLHLANFTAQHIVTLPFTRLYEESQPIIHTIFSKCLPPLHTANLLYLCHNLISYPDDFLSAI